MKALIIGGYGFIGSYLSKRLYKEGYDLYIIDNLSSSRNVKLNVKHKLYNLNSNDDKCENIFLDNVFSLVIYLAPTSADTENIGLNKILQYSYKNNVAKFIYVSSKSLNKEREESKDINNQLVEEMCKLYNEKSFMSIFCIKTTMVYGPGQNLYDTKNYISNLLMGNNKHKENSDIYRNYIFISDLIDGIYKIINEGVDFIYNISSDSMYTDEEVKIIFENQVLNKDSKRVIDLGVKSNYENKLMKEKLNWINKYSLVEGLRETYNWTLKTKEYNKGKKEEIKEDKRDLLKGLKKIFRILLPYIENLFLFILLYGMNTYITNKSISVSIDLTFIYIIVIAVLYGTSQSILATVLSSGLKIYIMLSQGISIFSIIYDPDVFLNISSYVFIGILLGHVIDNKNNIISNHKDRLKRLSDKFDFINEKYNEVRDDKKHMENQIISGDDSLGKIYLITQKLNSLNNEKLFDEAISVVCEVMKNKEACIYLFTRNKKYLRLVSKSKEVPENIKKSINVSEHPKLIEVVSTRAISINKDMDENIPTMISPIIINNEVIGIIGLYNMDFDSLTLYKHNIFKIVTNLITDALSRADKYEQAILKEKYIEDTRILTPKYFREVVKLKYKNYEEDKNHILLMVDREDYFKIINNIRTNDYIGINERNEMFIFLINIKFKEVDIVIKRFEEKGIKAKIIDEKYIIAQEEYKDYSIL